MDVDRKQMARMYDALMTVRRLVPRLTLRVDKDRHLEAVTALERAVDHGLSCAAGEESRETV